VLRIASMIEVRCVCGFAPEFHAFDFAAVRLKA
jgi:hypothetical protein